MSICPPYKGDLTLKINGRFHNFKIRRVVAWDKVGKIQMFVRFIRNHVHLPTLQELQERKAPRLGGVVVGTIYQKRVRWAKY